MSSRRPARQLLVAVLLGVLVGGGLMAVTPAGAEVSQAAATSWRKIWKKELRPLAAQAFYTKRKADSTFATKAESASGDAAAQAAANASTDAKLSAYYTKTQSDEKYAGAGSSYTRSESEARYARATSLVRGSALIAFNATGAGEVGVADVGFGTTFSAAPTVHFIPAGAPAPAGCSGTAAAPDAAPGHLCVFTSLLTNATAPNSCKVSNAQCFAALADPWGTSLFVSASGAGLVQYFATWAARPVEVPATADRTAPERTQPGPSGSGLTR